MMLRVAVWAVLGLGLVVAGCGDDDGGGAGGDAAVDIDAGGDAALADAATADAAADAGDGGASVPSEVLRVIEGDDDALAVDVLPAVGPVIGGNELDSDGRIEDRVVVMLDPEATVAQVNAALADHNLGIAFAMPPSLTVSIATEVLSLSAARALIAALESEGVTLTGWPAYPMQGDNNPQVPGELSFEANDTTVLELETHLSKARFPAAWNAFALAQDKVLVLVPDAYYDADSQLPAAHPMIPSQRFAAGSRGIASSTRVNTHSGNHGYWVSAIIGATWDGMRATGTSPDPARLLDILSIDKEHPSIPELLATMAANFSADDHFLINASTGYNDPEFLNHPMIARATNALFWRRWLIAEEPELLTLASAGNDGRDPNAPEADHNSAFATQARIADLRTLFANDDPNRAHFLLEWERVLQAEARIADVQGETLIIGGSNADGSSYEGSTPGHDLRMVAEQVDGACAVTQGDNACATANGPYANDGTSGSTPVATGLAAYLWSLDPELSASELRARLIAADDNDQWIDAYTAVLSLEEDNGPSIRKAIVDVVGGVGGRGDQTFDEDDVSALLEAFNTAGEETRTQRDWSRFDLNGDGYTSAVESREMDLDADGVIGQASFTQPGNVQIAYDEDSIGDFEALCFMAYQAAYEGDIDTRNDVLEEPCRDLNDGAIGGGLFAYEGTVTYTTTIVAQPMPSEICGQVGPQRSSTRTVNAMVHCQAFDPRNGVVACQLVDGEASGTLTQPAGFTPWQSAVEVLGSSPCAMDGDPVCNGDPYCFTQGSCFMDEPGDVAGVCSTCEAFRRTVTSASGGAAAELDMFNGSFVVALGTVQGVAAAELYNLPGVMPVIGSAITTTVARGTCANLAGVINTPTAFPLAVAAGLSGISIPINITDNAITGTSSGSESEGTEPAFMSSRAWDVQISLQRIP